MVEINTSVKAILQASGIEPCDLVDRCQNIELIYSSNVKRDAEGSSETLLPV